MTGATISSRAPTRIDLAGGWTDVAEFAKDPPGLVVNVAITLYSYVTLRARSAGDRRVVGRAASGRAPADGLP